jgi:hypothetical protein
MRSSWEWTDGSRTIRVEQTDDNARLQVRDTAAGVTQVVILSRYAVAALGAVMTQIGRELQGGQQ